VRATAAREDALAAAARADERYCGAISLFEEELQFLQALARSGDAREDLSRRCGAVGRAHEDSVHLLANWRNDSTG
jgi:hypothetical protein